jgi:hypothetical protein
LTPIKYNLSIAYCYVPLANNVVDPGRAHGHVRVTLIGKELHDILSPILSWLDMYSTTNV